MKKHTIFTKGKISKLHKKNKQTRKKVSSNKKNRKHRNLYTFRKKKWINLSNKTLKHLRMTGGDDVNAKSLDNGIEKHYKKEMGAKLEMPEIAPTLTTSRQEKISEEMINDLPEEMLEDIASGSIFESDVLEEKSEIPVVSESDLDLSKESVSVPEIQDSKSQVESEALKEEKQPESEPPKEETQPKSESQKKEKQEQQQEQVLFSNPFDSVNNVANIFATSSLTTPIPLPVYGGKKKFRLTKKSK